MYKFVIFVDFVIAHSADIVSLSSVDWVSSGFIITAT